jgi:hypothetical protein
VRWKQLSQPSQIMPSSRSASSSPHRLHGTLSASSSTAKSPFATLLKRSVIAALILAMLSAVSVKRRELSSTTRCIPSASNFRGSNLEWPDFHLNTDPD